MRVTALEEQSGENPHQAWWKKRGLKIKLRFALKPQLGKGDAKPGLKTAKTTFNTHTPPEEWTN